LQQGQHAVEQRPLGGQLRLALLALEREGPH
jgi:hypothetical protein